MKGGYTQLVSRGRLLLLALLSATLPLSAQMDADNRQDKVFSIGPFLGVDRVLVSTDENVRAQEVDPTTTSLTAPIFGLSATVKASDRFQLLLETGYQQLEFSTRIEMYSIGEKTAYRIFDYRTASIGLDGAVRYALGAGERPWYAEAGLYGEVPLEATLRRSVAYPGIDHTEYEGDLPGHDYGLTVGFGRRIGAADLRLRCAVTDRATYEERFVSYRAGLRLAYRF